MVIKIARTKLALTAFDVFLTTLARTLPSNGLTTPHAPQLSLPRSPTLTRSFHGLGTFATVALTLIPRPIVIIHFAYVVLFFASEMVSSALLSSAPSVWSV